MQPGSAAEANRATYRRPDVVRHYAQLADLQGAERYLFDRYIARGLRILDLGVGAGRTTRYLAPMASRYVGVDFSAEMIAHCRRTFPELEFHVLDAADLKPFADSSFDVVVFSYNGLDNLAPDAQRQRCLTESARVLKDFGRLIFSAHHARWIFQKPHVKGTGAVRAVWRVAVAARKSLELALTRLPSRTFWSGDGYRIEPDHGGLATHLSTPATVISELAEHGFTELDRIGAYYPSWTPSLATPSYYYAVERRPR